MNPIRVAVVDDSTFIRKALTRMLGEEDGIEVVGSASSGEELLANIDHWQPDVVTLDLNMPGIGGLATLDQLMIHRPTPVIILSTHSGEGAPMTIEALHRGAIDFIDKQRYSLVDFEALRRVLLASILQVTESSLQRGETLPEPPSQNVAETRRRRPVRGPAAESAAQDEPSPKPRRKRTEPALIPGIYDLVVLGASTGGPPTIERILQGLGPSLSVPVVVVQHMPVGFTQAFAERLNAYLPLEVREAIDSEPLFPDTVYIAPAGTHLRIRRHGAELTTSLAEQPQDVSHVPSIDILFYSAAQATGRRTIGVLLTGMGKDGAQGLKAIKKSGGYSIAQDEGSSIVFGMPRAAIEIAAVHEVGNPEAISQRLKNLVSLQRG